MSLIWSCLYTLNIVAGTQLSVTRREEAFRSPFKSFTARHKACAKVTVISIEAFPPCCILWGAETDDSGEQSGQTHLTLGYC